MSIGASEGQPAVQGGSESASVHALSLVSKEWMVPWTVLPEDPSYVIQGAMCSTLLSVVGVDSPRKSRKSLETFSTHA